MRYIACLLFYNLRLLILQLFESEKYEEAALHAATSPKVGSLLPHTMQSPCNHAPITGSAEDSGDAPSLQVLCPPPAWQEAASAALLRVLVAMCACLQTHLLAGEHGGCQLLA